MPVTNFLVSRDTSLRQIRLYERRRLFVESSMSPGSNGRYKLRRFAIACGGVVACTCPRFKVRQWALPASKDMAITSQFEL
jgi:hypothetical protein